MPLKPEAKRAYMRDRYRANPERFRAEGREWAKKNPGHVSEYLKKWRAANAEKVRALNARWRAENKERIAVKQREYYQQNRERLLAAENERWRNRDRSIVAPKKAAYARRKRQSDAAYAMMGRLRARLQMALKGAIKADSTFRLVGCSIGELCAHLEQRFAVGMTWENRSLWEIDHIRPCKAFDLIVPAQQRECFHYTNLQPLWITDNRKKSSKFITAAKQQMNGGPPQMGES